MGLKGSFCELKDGILWPLGTRFCQLLADLKVSIYGPYTGCKIYVGNRCHFVDLKTSFYGPYVVILSGPMAVFL